MLNRCVASLLVLLVLIPLSVRGDLTVTEAGPIDSAGPSGNLGNGTFSSAPFAGPSAIFTTLTFSGDLTEVLAPTFASEADFDITNGVGGILDFDPTSTSAFSGTIPVNKTETGLFWVNSGDTLQFEARESFDDGPGADSTWTNLRFNFSGVVGAPAIGSFAPGSFAFSTAGSSFDTELAL